MKDLEFEELINLYLDNEISEKQMKRLKAFISSSAKHKSLFDQYCKLHQASQLALSKKKISKSTKKTISRNSKRNVTKNSEENKIVKINKNTGEAVFESDKIAKKNKKKVISVLFSTSVAAACFGFSAVSLYLYKYDKDPVNRFPTLHTASKDFPDRLNSLDKNLTRSVLVKNYEDTTATDKNTSNDSRNNPTEIKLKEVSNNYATLANYLNYPYMKNLNGHIFSKRSIGEIENSSSINKNYSINNYDRSNFRTQNASFRFVR